MEALAYIAASIIGLWGIAHVIPTRRVLTQVYCVNAGLLLGACATLLIPAGVL
ncbi:MAG TPA: hypothetical protein VFN97_16555 [Actinospica sp.]|nr:hypothetical protein [Actinospica sp.]